MRWTSDRLVLRGISDEDSDGDIVTVLVETPAGDIKIMAEVEIDEDRASLTARGVNIQSDALPNSIGLQNIRLLATWLLESLDGNEGIVEGAPRTTGAHPGHRPRTIRFSR
jgi:hypothetical protein